MQTLKPQDQKTRFEFACRFLVRMKVDDARPWKTQLSNEAHIYLDGAVNTQNCRILDTSFPYILHQQPGRQCLQTTTFMQDEAIPHIERQVKALLSANFGGNLVISKHFPYSWSSRSPDLNPLDFWLWRFF
ncbi:uncharacterized protein TNCV_4655121 [Trichonephila clavipes]|nr:uncharacterized protein TNCV_4655121 [Trichonephila clavipes]